MKRKNRPNESIIYLHFLFRIATTFLVLTIIIIVSISGVFADGRSAIIDTGNTSVDIPQESFTLSLNQENRYTTNKDSASIPVEENKKIPRDLSDFVSDVLAFQTAILVLLIPLSFDVVSRISERYHSEIIISRFQGEWTFVSLVWILGINIALMIILRLFSIESLFANTLIFLLAIASMILTGRFFWLVTRYAGSTKYIKERLLHDAKQFLS